MSQVAELTGQLKKVLAQIRRADAYESVRLSQQAVTLTVAIQRAKGLVPYASHDGEGIPAPPEHVPREQKSPGVDKDQLTRELESRREEYFRAMEELRGAE
jgi:hypothetical protein